MQTKTAPKSDLDDLLDLNRDYIRSVQTSDVHRFREILAARPIKSAWEERPWRPGSQAGRFGFRPNLRETMGNDFVAPRPRG